MSEFIKWCNENQGYLSFLLTLVTTVISVVAIIVSIRTARLPYKKKIKLTGSFKYGIGQSMFGVFSQGYAYTVGAINIGNRDIATNYIGLGFYHDGKMQHIASMNRDLNCKHIIHPSELVEVDFLFNEIAELAKQISPTTKIYALLIDTEGKTSKKYVGKIENIVNALVVK